MRKGQIGQFGPDGRSHDAPDCGTYRLVRRVGREGGGTLWDIELLATCDEPGSVMTVRFVSAARYARHF